MASKVYELTDWSVEVANRDPFKAPEVAGIRLSGFCLARSEEIGGDPAEGVTTSEVVDYDLENQIATTVSGSRYRLVGPPQAEYEAWCRSNGRDPIAALGVPKP